MDMMKASQKRPTNIRRHRNCRHLCMDWCSFHSFYLLQNGKIYDFVQFLQMSK
jgi:hypothetical protein